MVVGAGAEELLFFFFFMWIDKLRSAAVMLQEIQVRGIIYISLRHKRILPLDISKNK